MEAIHLILSGLLFLHSVSMFQCAVWKDSTLTKTDKNEDSEIKRLIEIVINDVGHLTDHIQNQEKATSQRFQRLETHVTDSLQLQDIKLTEKLDFIKLEVKDQIQGIGTSFNKRMEGAKKDIDKEIRNLKRDVMYQIKVINEKTTENLREEVKRNIKVFSADVANRTKETERNISKKIAGITGVFTRDMKELKVETFKGINTEISKLKNEINYKIIDIRNETSKHIVAIDQRLEEQECRLLTNINGIYHNVTRNIGNYTEVLNTAIIKQNIRIDKFQSFIDGFNVSQQLKNMTSNIDIVKSVLTEEVPGKVQTHPAASCRDLYTHNYNIQDGYYWLSGKKNLTYCDMKNGGVPSYPSSCKELKEKNPFLKSGYYWIHLKKPVKVYCDMDTDGGGWLQVGSAVVKKDSEKTEVGYEKLLSDDVTLLANVKSNRFLLGQKGMNELLKLTSFTEIRFYCTKKWHGRTVDIKTDKTTKNGLQAVKFLLGVVSEKPDSCNSYKRLEADSSIMTEDCNAWYARKWNQPNMYYYPFYEAGKYKYFTLNTNCIQCDDNVDDHNPDFTTIGTWSYFVR